MSFVERALTRLSVHVLAWQVARCTKIIDPNTDDAKYVINVKQIAKFVVALGEKVAPTDIEEGMRVGVDRSKYSIQIPLPPKIDPTVTMMTVEEKPDVTYDDVGGAKESIEKLREVVELFVGVPARDEAVMKPQRWPPGGRRHVDGVKWTRAQTGRSSRRTRPSAARPISRPRGASASP